MQLLSFLQALVPWQATAPYAGVKVDIGPPFLKGPNNKREFSWSIKGWLFGKAKAIGSILVFDGCKHDFPVLDCRSGLDWVPWFGASRCCPKGFAAATMVNER